MNINIKKIILLTSLFILTVFVYKFVGFRFCIDRDCGQLFSIWLTKGVRDHGKTCEELPSKTKVEEVFRVNEQKFKDICEEQFMYDKKGMTDLSSGCHFLTSSQYQSYKKDFLVCENTGDIVVQIPVVKERFEYFDTHYQSEIFGVPFRIIPHIYEGLPRGGTQYYLIEEKEFDPITADLPNIIKTYVKVDANGKPYISDPDQAEKDLNKAGKDWHALYIAISMVRYKNDNNIPFDKKIPNIKPSLSLHKNYYYLNEYLLAAKRYKKTPYKW